MSFENCSIFLNSILGFTGICYDIVILRISEKFSYAMDCVDWFRNNCIIFPLSLAKHSACLPFDSISLWMQKRMDKLLKTCGHCKPNPIKLNTQIKCLAYLHRHTVSRIRIFFRAQHLWKTIFIFTPFLVECLCTKMTLNRWKWYTKFNIIYIEYETVISDSWNRHSRDFIVCPNYDELTNGRFLYTVIPRNLGQVMHTPEK